MSVRILAAIVMPLAAAAICGCVSAGYGGGGSVSYDSGYYEPYGYDYGGWGQSYYVAPWRGRRDDRDRHDEHHDRPHAPAYRPAPHEHPHPSLPHGRADRDHGHDRDHDHDHH